MICDTCGSERNYVSKEIELCWCKAELCKAHMAEHVQRCAAYKNPTLSPDRPTLVKKLSSRVFKGGHGFEAIGSMIKRQRRGR